MSRLLKIEWSSDDRVWRVSRLRLRGGADVVATFPTLADAEAYVIERTARAER